MSESVGVSPAACLASRASAISAVCSSAVSAPHGSAAEPVVGRRARSAARPPGSRSGRSRSARPGGRSRTSPGRSTGPRPRRAASRRASAAWVGNVCWICGFVVITHRAAVPEVPVVAETVRAAALRPAVAGVEGDRGGAPSPSSASSRSRRSAGSAGRPRRPSCGEAMAYEKHVAMNSTPRSRPSDGLSSRPGRGRCPRPRVEVREVVARRCPARTRRRASACSGSSRVRVVVAADRGSVLESYWPMSPSDGMPRLPNDTWSVRPCGRRAPACTAPDRGRYAGSAGCPGYPGSPCS